MRRTRLNSSVDSVFEIPRRSILNQMNHWTGGQIADEINDYLSETNPAIRVTNAFFTGNTLGIEYTAPDQDEAEDAFYYVLSDRYTPINSSRRSLKTQKAIRHCINSARRRVALQANRRLNCGYYYDGEDYSEMGYDKEQDAYYDLPDEMYIYKLDLSQFTDLVRDGIVSKHEIHEWIDELSKDWGGMPAWSPAKLIDKFEIQDLTKEQYNTWKANFAVESVRFRDELERRY